MQSTLEFSGALPGINPWRHKTTEGLLCVQRMLATLGFNLLQTAGGNGRWSCSHAGWRGGCTLVLQTGAPSFFLGTVPPEQTGYALPLGRVDQGVLCGSPWPENQIGILGGGSRFGLRMAAGARLRIVFATTQKDDRVSTQAPAFLKVDSQILLEIDDCLFPPEGSEPGTTCPPACVALIQSLSGPVVPHPRRARRHCERVGAALDLHQADPKKSLSTSVLSALQGVSLRTLENACVQISGHGPAVLHRIARLHAARQLLELGRETKVSRAADAVGWAHHGRFSTVYKNLFGESPSRTLPMRAPSRVAI
jgi:AraC-like DNA-binding protein